MSSKRRNRLERTEFEEQKINEIRELLTEKEKVGSVEKRLIRTRIRANGFYISSYDRSGREFTVEDFDRLVENGNITVRK